MNSAEKATVNAQIRDESKCLEELRKAYKQAKKDVQERLKALNARTDMQNLQTIIHQRKYQEQLLKQIDSVLNDLETHSYKTANEFFQGSYQNGYIGSMYELMKQGIPITVPVSTQKMVTAIQTDSKLSRTYYLKKGLSIQNIRTLKKQIALEATRGIASGKSWLEVAESLGVQRAFAISQSDAIRIVRTEGNRINQQGRLDSGDEAVKAGCDLLKQWDATLDGRTREAHREADGQIVEWDEDFTVGGEKMKAPSIGGSASNVCNCRCQLLKRPRWALDDEELEVLKKRAEYYGLDKSDSFDEFKKKYLKLPPVSVQIQTVQNAVDVRSTTKKLQSAMSDKDYQEYCDLIAKNPDVANLYKHADEIGSVKYARGSGCCWGKSALEFSYPDQRYIDNGMSKWKTLAHEYGHFFDTLSYDADLDGVTFNEYKEIRKITGFRSSNKTVLSSSDQFLSAMREDAVWLKNHISNVKTYCKTGIHESTGVQDAFDGLGLGRMYWGHGDRYYNRFYNDYVKNRWDDHTKEVKDYYNSIGLDASNQQKVKRITRDYETASELWANITLAVTVGGFELDSIKFAFPETYKVYLELIKKVA